MPERDKSAQVMLHSGAVLPHSPQALAEALASAAAEKRSITIAGASSKHLMAGPIVPADVTISTTAMCRVLQYEPRDLTISVEAGMRYAELNRLLAQNRQMVPLDPPFSDTATIGGILSANSSGPRRRLYGTARDLVIGMKFATLEGKLVQSGGMVVKNVAGLDMGKLMIGSFGTLAAIAVVNFKLLPMPAVEASFLLSFETLDDAIAARDRILKGVTAARGHRPAESAGGRPARLQGALARGAGGRQCGRGRALRAANCGPRCRSSGRRGRARFWRHVRGVHAALSGEARARRGGARFLHAGASERGDGVVRDARPSRAPVRASVMRISTTRKPAARWMASAERRGWKAVIEFAPDDQTRQA